MQAFFILLEKYVNNCDMICSPFMFWGYHFKSQNSESAEKAKPVNLNHIRERTMQISELQKKSKDKPRKL